MIAIVEAARAGLLAPRHWAPNLAAGVVVGVVALPLAMAFAIASGVTPERGIYTAIVAGLAVSLLGGSRVQVAGPTGAFIAILAAITARHGVDGLLLATAMAGVILLLLGLARFGGVLRFIPDPVIAGFTAGIGVIIWVGQWQAFFGLPATGGEHFHEKLPQLLAVLPELHPATTALAAASLTLVVYGPRVPGLARVPGPLLAMVAATLAHSVFHFDGVATIASTFGGIPAGLPQPALPAFSLARLVELIPAAFAIAMLGAIESLLSAAVADGMAGTRHDPNQELIGQGFANVLAPLFGGIAATGAIARTATSVRNGATSPLAGVTHAVTLVLILVLLAPLAGRIPLCALAAILFVVAWNMSEARHVVHLVRSAPRADVAVLLITLALTVFADLVVAVNVGVVLAMLLFMRRMAASVEVLRESADLPGEPDGANLAASAGVLVFVIEGPLFFAAVEHLERALAASHTDPRCVVIRLHRVPFMDISGIQALEEAIEALERRGVRVMLCEARRNVLRKLLRVGMVGRAAGRRRYAGTLAAALRQLAADGRCGAGAGAEPPA